jgi:exodeoxyribonuclease V alpha subunit
MPADSPADADSKTEELQGVIDRIVFRNEENGYTVCKIKAKGHPETVTVVGNCAAAWEGEHLMATGEWTRHPRHGYQFLAGSITCLAPATPGGIERYLASGMIKGIRKELARRLVEKFGDQTLEIIEKESRKLEQVEGIGTMRREMIKRSWDEQKAVRDIMIFLQGHGIGTGQAMRIYKQYGNDAVAVIRKNPYRLAQDVWGIGFLTADKVALSLGIEVESEIRARAGLIHVMQVITDEGHCFCPRELLVEESERLLEIGSEKLEAAIDYCLNNQMLVAEGSNLYSALTYESEQIVAQSIARLMSEQSGFKPIVVDKAVPWSESRMKISFSNSQSEALRMAMREKVCIITGGPGVGKTTIVRALVDVFQRRKLRILLAAPTGRAAKRMEEATSHEAKTIHRTLKYSPEVHGFEHDRGKPLEVDVIILDEVSMMDIHLTAALLDALPDETMLVLVGDIDQLPSVGPGNVLRDLIGTDMIPFQRLNTIFRQSERSWIVHNAHRVNEGEPLELPEQDQDSDFHLITAADPEDAIARMLDLVSKRIPRQFGLDARADIQVLTPMRRNQLGTINLNAILQEKLNPSGHAIERFGRSYREGDRLIQMRNNYDKGVFNGDIGIISGIDSEGEKLVVRIDGREVEYELSEMDELDHAYACSIHKSQGSEYPAVVVVMTTQHYRMLQRNLLYTAITRGRMLVCLITSHKAVNIAIRNDQIVQRRTGLTEKVQVLLRAET